jgi:hypothetical protein
MAGLEPWEQQDGEGAASFKAFTVYRELTGRDRSIRNVAEKTGESKPTIERWSSRNQWTVRATAFDRFLDGQWIAEAAQLRRETARRNVKIAGAMQGKIIERLQTIQPQDLSVKDLAYWFQITTQVIGQALGTPTRVEITGADGGPVQVAAQMTDEERAARLSELSREAERRLGELHAVSA